jgi:pyridoxine 4-dehydrogenase
MYTIEKGRLGPHTVSRIGYGAMQLAGPGVFGPPEDPEAARDVLRRAVELGVDHIDTSQYYGPDIVNELIREALYPYPEDLKLVSKVGARRDESGGWHAAHSPQELREGVEANLRTLGVESLAAVNLRYMDGDVPFHEQLGAMHELRQEGKIQAIGLSNVSRDAVAWAVDQTEIACVQNAFNILQRDGEDVVDFCAERGIAFVPFFPLGSAFGGGPKAIAEVPAVKELAERYDVTTSQVALAWLLHRAPHILLIPGTSSVAHLEENLGAARLELDAEDMAELG